MEEDIKDIEEILELVKEEIENQNKNTTAILDYEDLCSLKRLYSLYKTEKDLNNELQFRYQIEHTKYLDLKNDTIPKSKIQEKIEELEKEKQKDIIAFNKAIDDKRTHDMYTFDNRISNKNIIIDFLEELLEGDGNE